ncbi:SDR family oxidoreductase [Zhihengliuella flava]|uniref:NADP-dependent 3-hydroxy acid dehydrogenase YdfG n=1 Tax=Zhihengliuella flava TaxID=1285193 RepID=A0A931DC86_9MICC|nr:SDR family oxidoreductase [Zhihengliuella flava]MBG6084761.1 NADP-dependent 3-hydroxy acid dehydrogenase YdfG [Zhihengliuella flava]
MTAAASRPVALITGASRGIGAAIARELAETHHLLIGGRDEAAVNAVVDSLPSAEAWICELTGELAPLPEKLDVLVHSAGLESFGRLDELDLEHWRKVFELNVFAVAELTRQALPALRQAKGLVIAINSGAGHSAGPGFSVYAGSKFALRALTDSLREEERDHGVRVSSVHPGRVNTAMQERLVAAYGQEYNTDYYLAPEDIAATVRTVVDMPARGAVEEVSVRPTLRK